MKKLSLYERLLKNKNRLKVQAVSLVLATTAVVTTGCGKTDIVHTDVPKPGVEDVIAPNVDLTSEEIETLTAENFDEEATKIAENMKNKGYEGEFGGIKSVLLYVNAFDFSNEDGERIFELANETNFLSYEPFTPSKNFLYSSVVNHNTSYESREKYIELSQFSYNAKERTLVKYFDDLNITLTELSASGNIKQREEIFKFITDFIENRATIKIDGENLYFDDFSPAVKILIEYELSYTSTIALRCNTNSKIIKGFDADDTDEYLDKYNVSIDETRDKLQTYRQQKTFS